MAAPAFDAFTGFHNDGTVDLSLSHTPVGTPRGVAVPIVQWGNASSQINTINYGGVALSGIDPTPFGKSTGEIGLLYWYFLGANVPSGTQSLEIDFTNPGSRRIGSVITLTANANLEIETTGTLSSDTATDPSVNLTLGSVDALILAALFSGHDALASVTAASGYTKMVGPDDDFGSATAHFIRRNSGAMGPGTFSAGFTAAIEDAVLFAIAVKEIAGGGAPGTRARRRLNPGLN